MILFKSTVGDGIDTINGGSGNDTVTYELYSADLSVSLAGNTQVRVKVDGIDNDFVQDIENITTGSGNDNVNGDNENNTIITNNGDDTVSGGRGNDYLDGGNHTQNDDTQGSTTVKENAGDTVDYSYINDVGNGYEIGIKC